MPGTIRDLILTKSIADMTDDGGQLNSDIDSTSWIDHVGLYELGNSFIPFFHRHGKVYVAVRMVEKKVLMQYLNYLHEDFYSSCNIRSYYMTEIEAHLLNQVNRHHNDSQFFMQNDLVVSLNDVIKFHDFLDVCYNKLLRGAAYFTDKFGFLCVCKKALIPYVVIDQQKYLPAFYFDDDVNRKSKAKSIHGWDFLYLKFCFILQGINPKWYLNNTCVVISLKEVQDMFPNRFQCEEFWPNEIVDPKLHISPKGYIPGCGLWTKPPTTPPPAVIPSFTQPMSAATLGYIPWATTSNTRAPFTPGHLQWSKPPVAPLLTSLPTTSGIAASGYMPSCVQWARLPLIPSVPSTSYGGLSGSEHMPGLWPWTTPPMMMPTMPLSTTFIDHAMTARYMPTHAQWTPTSESPAALGYVSGQWTSPCVESPQTVTTPGDTISINDHKNSPRTPSQSESGRQPETAAISNIADPHERVSSEDETASLPAAVGLDAAAKASPSGIDVAFKDCELPSEAKTATSSITTTVSGSPVSTADVVSMKKSKKRLPTGIKAAAILALAYGWPMPISMLTLAKAQLVKAKKQRWDCSPRRRSRSRQASIAADDTDTNNSMLQFPDTVSSASTLKRHQPSSSPSPNESIDSISSDNSL